MARKKTVKVEESNPVQISLKWGSTESINTVYVNHMLISRSGTEFYVVFGELALPAVQNVADFPSELEIVPKVRLAIAPEAMKTIADVLYKHVQNASDGE